MEKLLLVTRFFEALTMLCNSFGHLMAVVTAYWPHAVATLHIH